MTAEELQRVLRRYPGGTYEDFMAEFDRASSAANARAIA